MARAPGLCEGATPLGSCGACESIRREHDLRQKERGAPVRFVADYAMTGTEHRPHVTAVQPVPGYVIQESPALETVMPHWLALRGLVSFQSSNEWEPSDS